VRGRRTLPALLVAALGLPAAGAAAHDLGLTDVLVVFKSDGRYLVDVTVDLDALALGAPPSAPSELLAAELDGLSASEFELALERARDTLLRRLRLRFDGQAVEPELTFPARESDAPRDEAQPSVLGTTARLSGRVPEGAREFTFFASRALGPSFLTILDQRAAAGVQYPLQPGAESEPYALGAQPAAAQRGVGLRYLVLGFEHILPRGLDHILFVLGLFLLATRLRPLLVQVTAFTLAHSVSLALSIYGVVALPPRLVESLIAASIVYVAVENLVVSELKPWRAALVFGFGLLHGLGFAGVLRELGLPEGRLALALASFNVGVELGQLAVLALAWLLLGWARRRSWYRRAIVVPACVVIALIGLWWVLQRAFLI
jgi:hypothetical protein